MKRIVYIIFWALALLSAGACVTLDELKPKPLASFASNLGKNGTANSYIVTKPGDYMFKPVKGNSSTSVGSVASVEVLWESFGTSTAPETGDLIKSVNYDSGYVVFATSSSFKEGNAVIAAKDADGKILWSWHIWLTDEPKEQVYKNNAGTMMDRNLGATSATPGDVGALGLLYQWGRKDPFLGFSSISSSDEAKSTITWPSAVSTSSSTGTVDYVTSHPTTYLYASSSPYDWHYSSRDNSLWTTSDKTKSIYDPCPAGWRVPDGGSNGVWSKAGFDDTTYDSTNEGMSFSISSPSTTWYPASGFRLSDDGSLLNVGNYGYYWSASPISDYAYYLLFSYYGSVSPSGNNYRANGQAVRCVKEGSQTSGGSQTPDVEQEKPLASSASDLATDGSANSYIVTKSGTYKFKPLKGNSSTSVGSVASVEVLWESFGTSETPSVGDLIKSVNYDSGYIVFATPSSFKEGNAVIAAKDVNGKILWSWHIWLTDQPEEQVYKNNAGTMMDRNLGATSATPGDVGALGLIYQWGRKDPFLGSSSIGSSTLAKSTITWPSAVKTSTSVGTVDYVTSHPTTFVTDSSSSDRDWHYSSRDNTLWTTSDKAKSIYDPCPAGWCVPGGGSNGVWSKAGFDYTTYDSTNEGMSFSISSPSATWYPASGCRYSRDGSLDHVGYYGYYWSAFPNGILAYGLYFGDYGGVYPSGNNYRASGQAVRCVKEGSQTSGGSQTPDVGQEKPLASSASDLATDGSANSYIVTKSGTYKFKPVKGNSSTFVGSVSKVEVLWETFGTSETPSVGDLIKSVNYDSGYVVFATPSSFKEGNAVIAAKDVNSKILWSWHIWLTDEPEGQEYYNNAGTMMDRNLGATSAIPGDVGALGLLYQWGRKDPFLGSSSISVSVVAKSTLTRPSAVSTSSSTGTVDYVTSHPTTYLYASSSPYDWHYSSRDNSLWTTSDKTKSIYDPCPAGWRVPDGGSNGVWSKAGFDDTTYDSTNEGMSFSISSPSTTWYPASGYRDCLDGSLYGVGSNGNYWSASLYSHVAYYLYFDYDGSVNPSSRYRRASGQAVRCVKEGSQTSGGSQTPDVEQEKPLASSASDLATDGSANSYIVTKSGTYKFKPVKGNSSTSVGSVSKVEVLWETFGTKETPSVGDLIKSVNYDSGYIVFATPSSFKEGNAVIAAKDVNGKILWSWHIWLTDQPKLQVYKYNAGTMMDCNLGATSSTPGDVGALGLLYQWGRKDPFLGSSSISSSIEAESTITWPSAVSTNSSTGTVDYVTSHPTTFVTGVSSSDYDWCYSSRDNSLWTTSDKTKSIYDPCPSGWRVPDGGSTGVWSKAGFDYTTYDSTNEGMSFSISSPSTTWYPASGDRDCLGGSLYGVGYGCNYWSASPSSYYAYSLYFNYNGFVDPSNSSGRASGQAVRCVKE